jgi:hypothetical protein
VALLGLRDKSGRLSLGTIVLWVVVALELLWILAVLLNHLTQPFPLDPLEGAVLQSVERIVRGEPIYGAPTPEFAPSSDNPGVYLAAAPAVALLGSSFPAVRTASVLGMLASGVLLFFLVHRSTGSNTTGIAAVGLFAGAYAAMGYSLDTAHSNALLIATLFGGTLLLDRRRDSTGRLLAMLPFIAAFWIQALSGIVGIGAIALLVARDGARAAIAPAVLLLSAGLLLYVAAGPGLFGPEIAFFSWRVPFGWVVAGLGGALRNARYLLTWYPFLLPAACAAAVGLAAPGAAREAWRWLIIPALLMGLIGTLDRDASNRVFVVPGCWLILAGTIVFGRLRLPALRNVALGASMAALLYDPRSVLVPKEAQSQFADLRHLVDSLPGTVYAPDYAYVPGLPRFEPSVQWLIVEDMIRGGHPAPKGDLFVDAAIEPLLGGGRRRFLIDDRPLVSFDVVHKRFLDRARLVADLGDRFRALRFLPWPWAPYEGMPPDYGVPRYVYEILATPTRGTEP